MYISVVTLPVNDVDRAANFYTQKLGWDKTMDVPMDENTRWVTVQPKGGQASFTLSKSGPDGTTKKAGGFTGVILEVDDVFDAQNTLGKAGVEFEEPAKREPWGGWATFKDSEGNIIGLHSPVTAAVSKN